MQTEVLPVELIHSEIGRELGPFALWGDGEWFIGSWDGETWHDDQGFGVTPQFGVFLPNPLARAPSPQQEQGRLPGSQHSHLRVALNQAFWLPLLWILGLFEALS